jgi:hypothetical protein
VATSRQIRVRPQIRGFFVGSERGTSRTGPTARITLSTACRSRMSCVSFSKLAGSSRFLDMSDNREFWRTELTGGITVGSDVGGLRGRKLYVFAGKVTGGRGAPPAAGFPDGRARPV